MFRGMTGCALLVIGWLASAPVAQAATPVVREVKVVSVKVVKTVLVKEYHVQHGQKFSHGFFYDGQHHKHWTKSYHCPEWKVTFYYCPSTTTWYYYQATRKVYYPISYLKHAVPKSGDFTPKQEVPAVPYAERPLLPKPMSGKG